MRILLLPCIAFLVLSKAAAFEKNDFHSEGLVFVENKNQWEKFIRFESDLKGGKIFLENNRFTCVFLNQQDIASLHPVPATDKIRMHAIRTTFLNSNPSCSIEASGKEEYHRNYFIGNDPSKWASHVGLFKKVLYKNIYSNIDLQYYSNQRDFKYDFIVNPGGNASDVVLRYDGADKLEMEDGDLIISTSVGKIVEQKPYAYQFINGEKTEVSCNFKLSGNVIRFIFPGGYDRRNVLIIDPVLIFSSFTGSSADNWGFTATYDASGNAYTGGIAHSIGYPVTLGAYQQGYAGGGASGGGFACDMAIAKFNPGGTSMIYATYIGGSDNEQPQSIVVDNNNDLVIYGVSYSSNYPVTNGVYQSVKSGNGDIVISKISSDGNALRASTFIGGSADDGVNTSPDWTVYGPIKYNYGDDARGEIIVDAGNNFIVASCTQSSDFPVVSGVQNTIGGGVQDGVVFKIGNSLTSLAWSTFLGGNDMDAAYSCLVDASGSIYVTGGTSSTDFTTTSGVLHASYQGGVADGFITRLSSSGNSILQSTFIGTSSYDQTFFIQQDFDGNIYTAGQTEGNYPVSAGVYSNAGSGQFIHKLSSNLSSSLFSTVFGNGNSTPTLSLTAFLVDTCENIYVSGWSRCLSANVTSFNMPVTTNAFQQSTSDGCDFYFIVLSNGALGLQYGSYFGSPTAKDHVDGGTSRFDENGIIYQSVCAGCAAGNITNHSTSDFPTTPGVVSDSNYSSNCNNALVKLQFNFSKTKALVEANPTFGCASLPVQFTNNSINGITYLWDFDDGTPQSTTAQPNHTFTSAGIYQVMLISRNNFSCNLADTTYIPITVVAPVPMNAAMNLLPETTCDSLLLDAGFAGSGGNIFQWSFGDGDSATGLNVQHTYLAPGTYQVSLMVSDTFCLVNDSVSEAVVFKPNVESELSSSDFFGCAPQDITFTNTASTPGTIHWDFDDGTYGNTSPVVHRYSNIGNYQVLLVVTDTASCNLADTSVYNLSVYRRPEAGFFYNHELQYFPATDITFTDTSRNAFQVFWNFGNLGTSSDSIVVHRFSQGGKYDICLTATSQEGCIDSACRVIEIAPVEFIYVPNSFTPNRDGHNDDFFPVTIGILDMKVRIFDRWGEQVAEWTGLEGKWNGFYKGNPAMEDVYVYVIDAVGSITPIIQKTGIVTLIY